MGPAIAAAGSSAAKAAANPENRQVAERSVAAGAAALAIAVPITAPVTGPVSVAATLTAVTDKAVSTGKIDGGDIAVTALSVAPAGRVAAELTEVHAVGDVVKSGQEVMHAAAAALGLGAAVAEKKNSQSCENPSCKK